MQLTDRIEAIIRAWPQWSPAEQRQMDAIVAEILAHVRQGTGNRFVQEWCTRNLHHIWTAPQA
jgi:hypothetical protein